MIRLILFIALAALMGAGAVWLADNDGEAIITLAGYEWRMSASVALLLIVAFAIVLSYLLRLAAFVLRSPARIAEWSARRHARRFFQSLSRGLVAAAAGDAEEADHFARRVGNLMQDQPLSLLLQAQAAKLAGKDATEEAAYRSMLNHPETEFLGLRGLFGIAMRRHDDQAALSHATRAHALKPKAWAMDALFDLRVSRREWREAQALVVQAARTRVLSSDAAKRRRAVLLAAQAAVAERAGEVASLEYALESLALAPGLTIPALVAARHLATQGRTTRARNIIEAAWADSPHRDLAEALAAAYPLDTPEARAKRLLALAKLKPVHRESRVLMAEQSVALKRWGEARNILTPLAEDVSSRRVCELMAEVAAGENDEITAQLWRSRAARGIQITQWRCTRCSSTADAWNAVCPTCGAFDTLRWNVPPTPVRALQSPAPVSLPPEERKPASMGMALTSAASSPLPIRREDEPGEFVRPDDPGPEPVDPVAVTETGGPSAEPSPARSN